MFRLRMNPPGYRQKNSDTIEKDIKTRGKFQQQFGDFPDYFESIYESVSDITMIGRRGIYANLEAIDYICRNQISGSIVECGVWRGGSIKAIILCLLQHLQKNRDVFLFDTFEGMVEPSVNDTERDGSDTIKKWKSLQRDGHNDWCYASLSDVKSKICDLDYPAERIHFVKGDDRETIPALAGSLPSIAFLRLDTDWYESTRVELQNLYQKVVRGGVIVIDDYGRWSGQRKAVDEYFETSGYTPLLMRINSSKRMIIKV